MRLELRDDDLPQGYTRLAVSACVDGELDAVERAVEQGRPRPEIATLTRAVLPPIRTWDMEAWRAALASDVAGHMTSRRMIGWSDPYRVIPAMDQVNRRETELLGDLQAGGRQPGALSEAERERILVAVQQLRTSNRMMTVGARVLAATAARVAGGGESRHVPDRPPRRGAAVFRLLHLAHGLTHDPPAQVAHGLRRERPAGIADEARVAQEKLDATNRANDAARKCAADPACRLQNDGYRRD